MSLAITISFTITIDGIDRALPDIRIDTPAMVKDEAEKIVSLVQKSAQQAPGPDIEPAPPGEEQDQATELPENTTAKFFWTPEMVETLQREVQAGTRQTPKPAMRTLLNDIAARLADQCCIIQALLTEIRQTACYRRRNGR